MSERNFALLGAGLTHTMSPPIHTRLFDLSGKPADYTVLDLPGSELSANIPYLRSLTGFNVTIPHKQTILPYLDQSDESCSRYGAVNVVHRRNGRLIGHNTDVVGFLRTMRTHKLSFEGKLCILGAGGVGRMFAIESACQGAALTLAVRSSALPAAAALREEIDRICPGASVRIADIAQLTGPFDLMINATPAGMYPRTDESPVADTVLAQTSVLFDCIYNPSCTRLMRAGAEHGCKVVGGMDMLVWQAAAAHEIWDAAVYDDGTIARLIDEMKNLVDRSFVHAAIATIAADSAT